ncbi:unnamed protein product, partial [Clonostachys rosea]
MYQDTRPRAYFFDSRRMILYEGGVGGNRFTTGLAIEKQTGVEEQCHAGEWDAALGVELDRRQLLDTGHCLGGPLVV